MFNLCTNTEIDTMDNTNKINNKILSWSKSLAERITDIRFIDINEMKLVIATHLKQAMYDCLRDQIPETEKKLNQLKIRVSGGGNNQKTISEIVTYKQRLKEENEMYANLDRENMGKEMTIWMREHHPESIVKFYEYYNAKFLKPSKNI